MKTTTTNATTTTATAYEFNSFSEFIENKLTDIYSYGYYVANKCLYNKESTSAQQFITNLINIGKSDRIKTDVQYITEQINKYTALYNKECKARETAHQKSKLIRITAEQRAEYHKLYLTHKERAERHKDHIDSLSKQLFKVSTNYADLVQTALLQHTINTINPPTIESYILEQYEVDTVDELTEEQRTEAQHRQNFKMCCRAVNNSMTAQLHHTTHNSHRTDILEPLPNEIINQIETAEKRLIEKQDNKTIYHYINNCITYNAPYKNGTTRTLVYSYNETTRKFTATLPTGNYYTFEYKKHKNPSTWYNVYHRTTTKNIASTEQFTNDKNEVIDITALIRDFNPHIIDTATDTIDELLTVKALTDRERFFIKSFVSDTAIQTASQHRQNYYNSTDKPTEKQALKAEYTAQKAYALAEVEKHFNAVFNAESIKKFMQRLAKRLTTAKAQQTAEPTAPTKIIDLLQWINHSTPTAENTCINWLTCAELEDLKQMYLEKMRENAQNTRIDNSTATAKKTAHINELRYTVKNALADSSKAYTMADSELMFLTSKINKHRAKAERKARGKARAEERAKAKAKADEQKKLDELIIYNAIQRAKLDARDELKHYDITIAEYNNSHPIQYFKKSVNLSALVFLNN